MADEILTFVPDGDPCPTHGLPTRLLQLPHAGLVSQCRGCIDDFLDWCAAQLRVKGSALPMLEPSRPVYETPVERAIRLERQPLDLFG